MKLRYWLIISGIIIFLRGASAATTRALFTSKNTNSGNSFTAAAQFPGPAPSALLKINEFVPNPSSDTGNKEWVEIFNPTASSVDLTNWTLVDDNNHVKSLSGTIGAGGFLVHEENEGWLNNGGDTVTLKDSNGTTVDTRRYTSDPGSDKFFGRDTDGTGSFKKCTTVTKGTSNTGSC